MPGAVVLTWLLLRLGVRPIEYFRPIAGFDFAHLRAIVFDQMLPGCCHPMAQSGVLRDPGSD
jgi:hypothetical protein